MSYEYCTVVTRENQILSALVGTVGMVACGMGAERARSERGDAMRGRIIARIAYLPLAYITSYVGSLSTYSTYLYIKHTDGAGVRA